MAGICFAAIGLWLVLQIPIGMLVGRCLRQIPEDGRESGRENDRGQRRFRGQPLHFGHPGFDLSPALVRVRRHHRVG